MAIELGIGFVSAVGRMQLQLVHAVGVIIARVTLDLHRIGQRGVFETPFVRFSAFPDVIDQLETLQVFVRLAMQLQLERRIGNN